MQRTHDVIVIGGGNGGLSAAAQMVRRGARGVIVIEPAYEHVYKPLQNYAAIAPVPDRLIRRSQTEVIPDGVAWHRGRAVRIDPDARTVTVDDGTTLSSSDIVIACGAHPNWNSIDGAAEALDAGIACTSFEYDRLERTRSMLQHPPTGRAIFTLPDQPASGRETALKPLFLACDEWRRQGALGDEDVWLICAGDVLHPVPELASEIERALERYGVRAVMSSTVTAISGEKVTLSGPDGTSEHEAALAHLVPSYAPSALIADSGLADDASGGFVAVDDGTLQHRVYPWVWAIGDAADIGAARTGGALRHQARTLVQNIINRRTERTLGAYDGYTVAPIAVSRRALVFGEYDARTDDVIRTAPLLSNTRPALWWYILDRFVLPRVYWHGILPGRLR